MTERQKFLPFEGVLRAFAFLLFSAKLKPRGYYLEHAFYMDHANFTNMTAPQPGGLNGGPGTTLEGCKNLKKLKFQTKWCCPIFKFQRVAMDPPHQDF